MLTAQSRERKGRSEREKVQRIDEATREAGRGDMQTEERFFGPNGGPQNDSHAETACGRKALRWPRKLRGED